MSQPEKESERGKEEGGEGEASKEKKRCMVFMLECGLFQHEYAKFS